jgi:hypothetical protein
VRVNRFVCVALLEFCGILEVDRVWCVLDGLRLRNSNPAEEMWSSVSAC